MFPLFFWRTVETEVTPNWCWLNSAIVLHLPFNLLSINTIFHHFLADFRNYSCCCCRYSCDSGRGCSCCCCCWLMRGTNLDLAGSDSGGVHRSGLAQQTIQLSPQFVKCFVLFSSGINECRGTNLFRWWLEAFCRLVRSVTITNRPNCVFGWTVSDATTTLPPFHRSTNGSSSSERLSSQSWRLRLNLYGKLSELRSESIELNSFLILLVWMNSPSSPIEENFYFYTFSRKYKL